MGAVSGGRCNFGLDFAKLQFMFFGVVEDARIGEREDALVPPLFVNYLFSRWVVQVHARLLPAASGGADTLLSPWL